MMVVVLRLALGASVVVCACAALPRVATAQAFPPVVDRDFAIDLYSGAAIGSLRTVGMGGAAVAIAEGSAGSIANPAAPAVRADTSQGDWDWDWHFDYLSTGIGADADNNGQAEEVEYDPFQGPIVTAGAVLQWRRWGLAVSGTTAQHPTATGADTVVATEASIVRIALARSFLGDDLVVGLGTKAGTLAITEQIGDARPAEIFAITGGSLEAGALWRPRGADLRLGAAVSLPVTGEDVTTDGCDPLDCQGYVVPGKVAVPWSIAIGGAWRRGATAWNRQVAARWRDERSWLYALDVVVTGRTPDGYGVEAYSRGELQRSGRHAVWSVRGGVEHEWKPGRVRLRAGSYWEPARFEAPEGDDVPGRLHLTFGADLRVWSFCFWDERYRLRLSVTADGAARYGNGGVSLGLWH